MAGEVNDMPETPPEPTGNPGEFPKVTKIPGGAILQTAKHPDDWSKYRPGDSFGFLGDRWLWISGASAL